MTQNNELDLILDDLVVVGADIIGVGERIDKLYEGERTLYKHFLFSENELLAFLKLRDTRAESPISQNEQQEAVSTLEDWLTINMPSGTVIGNPLWWARKIRNVLAFTEAPKQMPEWIDVSYEERRVLYKSLAKGNIDNFANLLSTRLRELNTVPPFTEVGE